jgi:hypothetical protein
MPRLCGASADSTADSAIHMERSRKSYCWVFLRYAATDILDSGE